MRPVIFGTVALIAGCASSVNRRVLNGQESQVQLRSFQARAFDTTDIQKTLRTVIGTRQDLGFVIDKGRRDPRQHHRHSRWSEGSNEYKLGTLLYTLWFEPPFPTTDNTLIVSVES